MTGREWMDRYVESKLREDCERLERQAMEFLKMGYSLDELTVVQHDDGTKEVSPKSAVRD